MEGLNRIFPKREVKNSDGIIVGLSHFQRIPTLFLHLRAYLLSDLFVDSNHDRRKIAEALYDHTVDALGLVRERLGPVCLYKRSTGRIFESNQNLMLN